MGIVVGKKSSGKEIPPAGQIRTISIRKRRKKSQRFYKEFKSELSKEHINQLQVLFNVAKIATNDVNYGVSGYVANETFREIYKQELAKHFASFKESEDQETIVSKSLKNHYFSVLFTYLDIIENIDNPHAVENILQLVASSHGFLCNRKPNLKLHNHLLLKLFKETGKHLHKGYHKSFHKYITLINKHLQLLLQWNDNCNFFEAMARQKSLIKMRAEKLDGIKEIYCNSLAPSHSSCSLISFSTGSIYPGTSAKQLDDI